MNGSHCDACGEKVYQVVPSQPSLFSIIKPDGSTIWVCYKCKEKLQYLYRLQRALEIISRDAPTVDRMAKNLYYFTFSSAGYVGNRKWEDLPEEADFAKESGMEMMGKRLWRKRVMEMLEEAKA